MDEKNYQGPVLPQTTSFEDGQPIRGDGPFNMRPKIPASKRLGDSLKLVAGFITACALVSSLQPSQNLLQWYSREHHSLCVQEPPLQPSSSVAGNIRRTLKSDEFTARAAEALGGAIRVPTEVFDDWGPVDSDPSWGNFSLFHNYLAAAFPRTHSHLSLTKVNTYGLLYEWKGLDEALDPILFMAHQDVVPVDPATYPLWKVPPYSGKLVDGYVWGRGSVDDKSNLIAMLLTIEALLEEGWTPKRSITLSFGFDEEASGLQGASSLAKYLQEHQKQKFAMIVDEGAGYDLAFGKMTAMPGIAEKGYMDVRVKVNTLGGHSSNPPAHTSIGYLALLLAHIEANPRPIHITPESPIFKTIECSAVHGPDMPKSLREQIILASKGDKKALRIVEQFIVHGNGPNADYIRSILGTTQAIDMIHGGVKANVLPEEAFAIVNHRIATDSSIAALKDSVVNLLYPVASKYNLELVGFDNKTVSAPPSPVRGKITVSDAWKDGLEPAPITPTDSEAYKLLSGSIRAAWEDAHPGEDSIIVAPSMMSGNTDTRWYWTLSDNIFRYSHTGLYQYYNGIHTVNEAIRLDGFVDLVKFYSTLILNADESQSI